MTISDLRGMVSRIRTMRGRVEVGVPDGPTERDGTSIATIAAAHVFGTSRIPQRDFLRPAIEKNLPSFQSLTATNLVRVATGQMNLETALGQLGAAAAGAVQAEIVSGSFAPLAPATVRRKKSSKPLIDSGNMRQSITFRVTTGGG